MNIVIDASVAIKWFIDEDHSDWARSFLKTVLTSSANKYFVPELFFYEVYSVSMRRHPRPENVASNFCHLMFALPLERLPFSDDLAKKSSQFMKLGVTGYDASYLAVAEYVAGKWLTFDKDAAKKLGKTDLVLPAGK